MLLLNGCGGDDDDDDQANNDACTITDNEGHIYVYIINTPGQTIVRLLTQTGLNRPGRVWLIAWLCW